MGLRQLNQRLNSEFRQWIDLSISNRISVATLSVTVLVLFLLIGATYSFLHHQLDRQAQTTLSAHAGTLAARLVGTLDQAGGTDCGQLRLVGTVLGHRRGRIRPATTCTQQCDDRG